MIKKISFIAPMFIIVAIIYPVCSFVSYKESYYQNEVVLNEKIKTNDYFAILQIEKIDLKAELYPKNSSKNNVDKNVLVHSSSTFPTAKTSNLILAAHSGNGKYAYFQNLYKLKLGDEISLYYDNTLWIYEIKEIEYQDKTGKLYIKEDYNQMLTLITCTKDDSTKQTIYYAALKNSQKLEK